MSYNMACPHHAIARFILQLMPDGFRPQASVTL